MNVTEDYLPIVRNMEVIIVMIYRQDGELLDYEVDKALSALLPVTKLSHGRGSGQLLI